MKHPVLFIGGDSALYHAARQLLATDDDFQIASRFPDVAAALPMVSEAAAPVVVVAEGRDGAVAARLASRQLKASNPACQVLLAMDGLSGPFSSPAISASEDLAFPSADPTGLAAVFEITRARRKGAVRAAAERGKYIVVTSNKGGVGSTTVATNIAANLARRRLRVCLVDLVLQFGSVSSFLNLEPASTIIDAVKRLRAGDPLFLDGALMEHASGLKVLAEPWCAEDARRITSLDIGEVLHFLGRTHDFIVIDTPKEFDETHAMVLERADRILFVTELSVPSLRSARRALDLFRRMALDCDKIRLVINRYVESRSMSIEMVEESLGVKLFWTLPNNYPLAVAAVNQGMSIEECGLKSDLADSYAGLTDAIVGSFEPADGAINPISRRPRRGLMQRWLNASGLLKS